MHTEQRARFEADYPKANREPFVVKMPELQPDGWVKLHEVIAAITAAGGRCV